MNQIINGQFSILEAKNAKQTKRIVCRIYMNLKNFSKIPVIEEPNISVLAKEIFKGQLMCLDCNEFVAECIVSFYPTLRCLYNGYSKCNQNISDEQSLLHRTVKVKFCKQDNFVFWPVSLKLSKSIWNFFLGGSGYKALKRSS